MLTVKPAQYRNLAAREEQAFLQRLQAKLERDEPALLPRFPPRQRAAIVANICRRARTVGATWESAIGAWGGCMVGIAPNLGRDPAVRAWLASTGATPDETITRLPDLLTVADHGAQAIDDPARVWNDARATVGRAYTADREFAKGCSIPMPFWIRLGHVMIRWRAGWPSGAPVSESAGRDNPATEHHCQGTSWNSPQY